MKMILFLSLFIFSYSSFASELTNLLKPSALKELNWDKSFSKKEAEEFLGKASLEENNSNYYIVAGIKYPLTIEFKKDKVSRIFAMLVNQKVSLEQMAPYLKEFKKVEAEGKEQELYYYLESTDKKLRLKFTLIEHTLYSAERWY